MSTTTDLKKQRAAQAALGHVRDGMILGIGTGSTVNVLLELLIAQGGARRLRATVSSSESSSADGYTARAYRYWI